jgi:hypothetical protein
MGALQRPHMDNFDFDVASDSNFKFPSSSISNTADADLLPAPFIDTSFSFRFILSASS